MMSKKAHESHSEQVQLEHPADKLVDVKRKSIFLLLTAHIDAIIIAIEMSDSNQRQNMIMMYGGWYQARGTEYYVDVRDSWCV